MARGGTTVVAADMSLRSLAIVADRAEAAGLAGRVLPVVGGVPVFVDIREDTLNLDERRIEAAITPKTKADQIDRVLHVFDDIAQYRDIELLAQVFI